LWNLTKAGQAPADEELARMQKYMAMHEDMHAHFERIAQDPSAPLDVDGENLPLHIAMDAATEAALERGEPDGLREIMQGMLSANVDPSMAFHAISQAMMHEFVIAASNGQEMDLNQFLARAANYAMQARGRGCSPAAGTF
jgi:hypothetical protein